jgi:hypothetical protein
MNERRAVWNLEAGIFDQANARVPMERDGHPVHRVPLFPNLLSPGSHTNEPTNENRISPIR